MKNLPSLWREIFIFVVTPNCATRLMAAIPKKSTAKISLGNYLRAEGEGSPLVWGRFAVERPGWCWRRGLVTRARMKDEKRPAGRGVWL